MVRVVDYRSLPLDFWDKVVYYEYFISFSGFCHIKPHITAWTKEGECYYLNEDELRDGRFDRMIPFFGGMADHNKIKKGDFLYFDWEQIPSGWKYYYNNSHHCFIPDAVYEVYDKWIKKAENEFKSSEAESLEERISRLFLWMTLLKEAYKEVLGIQIDESIQYYIMLDEKIHVYYELYAGETLYIDKITRKDIDRIKKAVLWDIEYTAKCEGLYKLVRIDIYFETEIPIQIYYEFEREYCYIDENEFMHNMMTILGCNLGNEKDGYSFDEAPNGFTVFKLKDDILKTYWIRDDVYRSNVHNVIEAFDNYDGNTRYLRSPVCACNENKLRFTQ